MRRIIVIASLGIALALTGTVLTGTDRSSHASAQAQAPLAFHDLAERVTDRYEGRLLAAEIRPPSPAEKALGAMVVYEFRLLTTKRNLLKIRLDAGSGRFLEVAGRGQLAALKTDRDEKDED